MKTGTPVLTLFCYNALVVTKIPTRKLIFSHNCLVVEKFQSWLIQWFESHQRLIFFPFFYSGILRMLGVIISYSSLTISLWVSLKLIPDGWLVWRKQFSHVYFGRQVKRTYRIFNVHILWSSNSTSKNSSHRKFKWTKTGIMLLQNF